MMNGLEEDNSVLDKTVSSDEATIHVSKKVNRHNVITRGSQNPHQVVEHVRDRPKVDVFCAVSRTHVYGSFFSGETIITGHLYLDVVKHFVVKRLDVNSVIWQQYGAPPHCHRDMNQTFFGKWIGRGGHVPWPPKSPDLTPTDFSFWGFVKDNVYKPAMPVDLQELRERTVTATALVNVTLLNKLWDELRYRLDVCRITRGSHIERL
jgi:hypothetical protein